MLDLKMKYMAAVVTVKWHGLGAKGRGVTPVDGGR